MNAKEILTLSKTSTENQTEVFEAIIAEMGMTNYVITKSVTDFGKSNYIKFYSNEMKNIFTVRLSDHSVGIGRLNDEVSLLSFLMNTDDFMKCYKSYNK